MKPRGGRTDGETQARCRSLVRATLSVLSVMLSGCTSPPDADNDTERSEKIVPPEIGVYLGQTEIEAGDIAAFERATGRSVAIAADLSIVQGQEEAGGDGLHFDIPLARKYWKRGAVVLVGAYEATPGHKPFTVDKLLRGNYDDDLKKLAAQFRAFGKPMFFGTAREPNGVLATDSGGFGPHGDKSTGWAEVTGRDKAEFQPPEGPPGNSDLYAGLGNPEINDGIERLAAAQRYYYDFFVRREGLQFLTFETMGWAVPTWEKEPQPIAQFDEFYPLISDYSDWVSINFYMWTEPLNEDTGETISEAPMEQYLNALRRVMGQLRRVAPGKPVLITELGFAEPNRVEKIRRGLEAIVRDYPEIKGCINWGGDMAIRPGTPAAAAYKQLLDENAGLFHSRVHVGSLAALAGAAPKAQSASRLEEELCRPIIPASDAGRGVGNRANRAALDARAAELGSGTGGH